MAKFLWQRIRTSIANSPQAAKRVNTIMHSKFEDAKYELSNDIESHVISREIRQGISASNFSNTLLGYGNLYSFLGFEDGRDPVGEFIEVMNNPNTLILKTVKRGTPTNNGVRFEFSVGVNLNIIKNNTKMDWEPGNSWVLGIERGISGLSSYLSGKFRNPPSRSLGGIQAKDEEGDLVKIRGGSFKTTPYLSEIIQKFAIRAGKRSGGQFNLIQYNR